jgi:MFS family permease
MPEAAPTPTPEVSSSSASDSAGEPAPSSQPAEGSWRRSFWSLNITQFQGAFSANAFQNLLSYMVLGMGLTHEQRDKMVPLILLFFSVPLVLFSMAGGFLADRFSKRQVIIWTKLIEIACCRRSCRKNGSPGATAFWNC